MTNASQKRLSKAIKEIARQKPIAIEVEVAREALLHDDIPTFFEDLAYHGCVCGMIGRLIYYFDTHEFFERHYDEIEELREKYELSTGTPLLLNGDLKNHLAWFAFEETARRMYGRLK